MRVLVAGATGNVGRIVVEQRIAAGVRVRAIALVLKIERTNLAPLSVIPEEAGAARLSDIRAASFADTDPVAPKWTLAEGLHGLDRGPPHQRVAVW